jgi:hypothetical protein
MHTTYAPITLKDTRFFFISLSLLLRLRLTIHPPHFFFNPKTSFAPKTPKPTTPIHPLHWNPTPKPKSWNQILQILAPNPPNRDRSGSHIAMELSKFARNEAHASAHQSEPNSLLCLSLAKTSLADEL